MTGNEIGNGPHDDSDAILAGFLDAPEGSLESWARRYPSLARDFARAAESRRFGVPEANERDAARVAGLGLQMLRERRAAHQATALVSLLAAADAAGHSADSLAEVLRVPFALIGKLHRRFVAVESIPGEFLERLSVAVRRGRDEVAAYLALPPQLAAGASYRADESPRAHQETFQEALEHDPDTTDAMRALWRAEPAGDA